jgi:hypothetical protein
MPEGAAIGMWIVIGIAVLALIISGITSITKKGDEEEHDIEHLDHEIKGDALGH